MGGCNVEALSVRTSRRFSPACCRPVKKSAIERPSWVETMPLVKMPVRPDSSVSLSISRRRLKTAWMCHRCATRRFVRPAGSTPRRPEQSGPPSWIRFPTAWTPARVPQALFESFQPMQGESASVSQQRNHPGDRYILLLVACSTRSLSREHLSAKIAAQFLHFIDGRFDRRLAHQLRQHTRFALQIDFARSGHPLEVSTHKQLGYTSGWGRMTE